MKDDEPVEIPREALERISRYLAERHAVIVDRQDRRRVNALLVATQQVLDPDTNRSKKKGRLVGRP